MNRELLMLVDAISREILSTAYFGVPLGATMPNQPPTWNFGMPASENVGTSGSAAARVSPEIAIGFILPPLICEMTEIGT